jgi:MFS superfamily sulfate permease-like transporter
LLFGVALSILSILYKAARPKTSVYFETVSFYFEENNLKFTIKIHSIPQVKDQQCIYVKPSSGLDFPGVDFVRERVNRAVIATDSSLPVALDFARISTLDYTSIKGIESLTKDLEKQNQSLTLLNVDEKLEKKMKLNVTQ